MEQALFAINTRRSSLQPTHPVGPGFEDDAVPVASDARMETAMVLSILDHVHFGVALVGADLQLLFANQAARRECDRHPALRIDHGTLAVLDARLRNDLLRGVNAARDGRWSLVQALHGDERLILGLRPLLPAPALGEVPVLLTFGLRSEAKPLSIQFFAKSCGLSPAETEVLRALGEGLSPKEIARRNEVALSTVRTQLGCVRAKTGARSITDLVRTLGSLPPMMPVGFGTGRNALSFGSAPPATQ